LEKREIPVFGREMEKPFPFLGVPIEVGHLTPFHISDTKVCVPPVKNLAFQSN